ncbi:MAG: tetratricopeptide repeat protein [Bacteroidetes bacterium]|nr:tetratricopeptide repeat protein [Bacteroidota bacterium]
MMGNIFAKFKNDIPTAMKYYDQAIIANPNESIAINNIGGNLLQQGKTEEAKKYFNKALSINNNYPNTHFALGMIAEIENDFHSAFYSTIKAIKLNINSDILYKNSVDQAIQLAKKMITSDLGVKTYTNFKHKLEFEGNTKIDIVEDTTITTAAKIEFAEIHKTINHVIKFKSSYPAVEHLIMHELIHLDFVIEARKADVNMLFISNQSNKRQFVSKLDVTIKNLKKNGLTEEIIEKQYNSLFEGINQQIFNTPIDLFIEDIIYKDYEDIRAYQFISLFTILQEGIQAVTDKRIIELFQADIISKSKIYNMVNALQFKDLYGIDLTNEFKATQAELKTAKEFYNEYLQYKYDKEPAEEYELVQHWAEDLKLDTNFELIDENTYRNKRTDVNSILESIEKEPFDIETKDPFKKREMEKFQKAQAELGTNMAVVMYMVDALQYFNKLTTKEIKEIAFEIAMQGTQGYSPDKSNYTLHSIPGKIFTGYHILAYYYVSWSLAIPDMVTDLNLPYEKEYELALTMHKPIK